jgi:transcriptional regulator with XRE-family HTH domain
MTPHQFKAWRKAMGFRQREAAERLGLKKRVIQYYEHGARDGKKVEVPKAVELACYALAVGVEEYDGAVKKARRR